MAVARIPPWLPHRSRQSRQSRPVAETGVDIASVSDTRDTDATEEMSTTDEAKALVTQETRRGPATHRSGADHREEVAADTGRLRRRATRDDRAPGHTVVSLDVASVWRAAWVVLAALVLASLAAFFFSDGAPVIFIVTMGFFASIALEPAVARLARWMPRPLATALVMILVTALVVLFGLAFGGLLRDQVIQLLVSAPALAEGAVRWTNETFDTRFEAATILDQVRLDSRSIAQIITTLAGGVLGVVGSLASAAFTTFSFLFFTYYLSADAPRLRTWVAQLFPPRQQVVVLTLWQLTLTKVGGYVAARVVLALICSTCTGAFLYIIDMPYWLPLAIWTGVVAQFVPTIGTYLAILLPVLVGLLGPEPAKGIWTFVFAVVYQQIENLTWEPRISARAVSVHPAVSFASALLGAALFGVSGALVGVPVSATLIAVFDIYKQRYELSSAAEAEAFAAIRPDHG